jgi:hypothetical protein
MVISNGRRWGSLALRFVYIASCAVGSAIESFLSTRSLSQLRNRFESIELCC